MASTSQVPANVLDPRERRRELSGSLHMAEVSGMFSWNSQPMVWVSRLNMAEPSAMFNHGTRLNMAEPSAMFNHGTPLNMAEPSAMFKHGTALKALVR
jgi:hypothetical protein